MLGYEINSRKCGRDKKGRFHCRCGKCKRRIVAVIKDDSALNKIIQEIMEKENTPFNIKANGFLGELIRTLGLSQSEVRK